jgi:hypothetical protein
VLCTAVQLCPGPRKRTAENLGTDRLKIWLVWLVSGSRTRRNSLDELIIVAPRLPSEVNSLLKLHIKLIYLYLRNGLVTGCLSQTARPTGAMTMEWTVTSTGRVLRRIEKFVTSKRARNSWICPQCRHNSSLGRCAYPILSDRVCLSSYIRFPT